MKKKWNVKRDCRGLNTNEIIDAILEDRGVEDAIDLLHPTEDCLVPFEEMKNIDKAAQVILDGIEKNMQFMIHADIDSDGTSANAIAFRWLKQHTDRVSCIINEGKKHGIKDLDLSLLYGVDILWIVDSIETEYESYQRLFDAGIYKVIITDHHIVSKVLQKQMERNGDVILVSSAVDYPNPHLSGSATTWKLCNYMDWLDLTDYSDDLVDLAACGIVADMTSVGVESPENRYLCYKGFNNQVNPAIKKINGSYEFNSQAVSFGISPLINAANRMGQNEKAMQLFLSDDSKEIGRLINDLKGCKEDQNAIVADLLPQLEAQAEAQTDNKVMFFFVESDGEVKGLIGNKLLEKYKRPVFVLQERIETDPKTGMVIKHEYAGSCRAIGVENFKEYVDQTGLVGTGGHENSFGLWFDVDDLNEFRNAIEDAVKHIEFIQETMVDIQLSVDQINSDLIRKIKMLDKISGHKWSKITVMVSDIEDYHVSSMSAGKHLKLQVGDRNLLLIKWNFTGDFAQFNGKINVIGGLNSGCFGRTYYEQLIIDDFECVNGGG